jgi:hypothetical protein
MLFTIIVNGLNSTARETGPKTAMVYLRSSTCLYLGVGIPSITQNRVYGERLGYAGDPVTRALIIGLNGPAPGWLQADL